ncbi:methylated-DNA--[protein]-cysteine S-methyltransferase [Leucobacter luti]|uniref:methylated-DNA--[protein]-cysteine S-methyltransferase n=1 Tax=Leucobacter luti TaxID=340320 RepID=UPI003D06E22F
MTRATRSPLAHTVVEVVGRPFEAVWSPEDGVLRAGGFVGPGSGSGSGSRSELFARLAVADPAFAARGLAPERAETGEIPDALRDYAGGELDALDAIRVSQPGTPFRAAVWEALRRVPAGRAVTYTELAGLAGRPRAVRAAASGCANNLVALVVPCHRIVRSDGGLGGYLFGVETKELLLAHEGARPAGASSRLEGPIRGIESAGRPHSGL